MKEEISKFFQWSGLPAYQWNQRSSDADNHHILLLKCLKFPLQNGALHNRTTSKNIEISKIADSELLENHKEIHERPLHAAKVTVENIFFQLDGATAHTGKTTMEKLKAIFPNR